MTQMVEPLGPEGLNWKPAADQWSVLQILDHLIAVNTSYFPITEELKSGTYKRPFLGRINFFVNLFGKLILKSVQPEEFKKTRTFPIWEPASSNLDPSTVSKFFDMQKALSQWIRDNEDLILQNPVVSSPANNNIVYRFQVLLDIIIAHEQRHLLQLSNLIEKHKATEV